MFQCTHNNGHKTIQYRGSTFRGQKFRCIWKQLAPVSMFYSPQIISSTCLMFFSRQIWFNQLIFSLLNWGHSRLSNPRPGHYVVIWICTCKDYGQNGVVVLHMERNCPNFSRNLLCMDFFLKSLLKILLAALKSYPAKVQQLVKCETYIVLQSHVWFEGLGIWHWLRSI